MNLKEYYIDYTKNMLIEAGEKNIRLEILKQELPTLIKDLEKFKGIDYSNESIGYGNKRGIDDLLIKREEKIEKIKEEIKDLEKFMNRLYIYIDKLDNDYREVLIDRYINIKRFGKLTTFEKISDKMNLAETTVKRYNRKAICQLTRLINGDKAIQSDTKIDIK
ncbi:hypothetical protein ACOV1W_03785 [Paraclostridium bifermentans]|uniref:hypothetical protein n=1 Tax=Paraclostridium bifermentans TaxID=1490 RepID=UPI003D28A8E6